jgi:hypothetical protein
MVVDDLDTLASLDAAASSAPWHVVHRNDAACMSALAVVRNPSTGRTFDRSDDDWQAEDTIAACLHQSPSIAMTDDQRWTENARLIATVRNALPELIRLARVGLEAERRGA